ncbi:MAG: insulinase family protein [Planctomycetes bacterium]|nr:insulinase family protein [Planctomycetota bacterium]
MNRVYVSVGVLIAFGAGSVSAQDVKVEKYQLDNGMTVILHEDHSLPVACINTWFYVGSKDEAPGRSGFAHLFEHLMFMGTRRVAGNSFDVLMERGGGNNNASTTQDRTNYYSTGPSSLLPTLLWLDADRLEDLGKEMTQEKLDKQRDVVRNERRQTSEMRPYGKADLKITELMFPPGHPYHIEVIGTHEDLQAATVRDVKDFFAAYYLPNNASLVVAGDFDPKEIKPLIAKLFGTLQRGPEPIHRKAEPVALKDVCRVTYTDAVQFARTTMVYHSPAAFSDGDADMDLAAAVLATGKSSRLYERLVYRDKIATEVSANQESMYLGSLFQVEVTAKPGVSLDQIEKTTDEVLAEFVEKGPTQEELERQKTRIEYMSVASLQSVLAKADSLNRYQFYFGEPNSFKRDLDRYRHATTESVQAWSKKVLTPNARLVMRVLPEEKDAPSPRDKQPDLVAEKPFAPTGPEVFTLSNGLEVRHWERRELPLVNLLLQLPDGAGNDEASKAGLSVLSAGMIDEGAGSRGALEFSNELNLLGATLMTSVDQESGRIGLSVLRRNFDAALALYADAVARPRMEEKEWDRVKTLHLQALKQAEDRPTQVAARVGMRTFFGDGHPYGRPTEGTMETVKGLDLAAIKARYQQMFNPKGSILFVAGDLSASDAKAALEKALGSWKGTGPIAKRERKDMPAPPGPMRVVLVDKPQSVQTVIRFYAPAPTYRSPDRVRLGCLNTILGGSFTSRLNQNLREQHGYTYGARSSFNLRSGTGYFSAGADVQAEYTGAALQEFMKEFDKIRAGDITSEEAEKARKTNRVDLVEAFQGLGGLLAVASEREQNGLPFSSLGDDLTLLGSISEADLNPLARPAIALENAVLVLVGDKKLIGEQLKNLALPTPSELTVTGDRIAK